MRMSGSTLSMSLGLIKLEWGFGNVVWRLGHGVTWQHIGSS